MPNVQIAEEGKKQNPMLGIIGFIVLVVIGGFSLAISGPVKGYLQGAHVNLAGAPLLPLHFPPEWSPFAGQVAVAVFLFLIIFVVAMIILFMFMKPSTADAYSVSLDDMRREVAARKKRR